MEMSDAHWYKGLWLKGLGHEIRDETYPAGD